MKILILADSKKIDAHTAGTVISLRVCFGH
jgi:hypothetical protein